jgi:hypothetical protein
MPEQFADAKSEGVNELLDDVTPIVLIVPFTSLIAPFPECIDRFPHVLMTAGNR